MTTYQRGDIVLVALDFTDRSRAKLRPALVVSSSTYNDGTPDLLIASITSNLHAVPHPGDHIIVEWQAAGLLRPSLAQTKLATIESTLVSRKLGTLMATDCRP